MFINNCSNDFQYLAFSVFKTVRQVVFVCFEKVLECSANIAQ